MYLLSIQTRQQLRFHSVSRSPDVRSRYFTKEGNAFLSFVWNAKERISERVRIANGTRLERVLDAFGAQMERERSVRLFLSSTVCFRACQLPVKTVFKTVYISMLMLQRRSRG